MNRTFAGMVGFGLGLVVLGLTSLQLSGCGAAHTMVKKRNLDVQTKMSETIFLEPVAPAKRTIFVDIRNTSDKELPVKEMILQRIRASGYTLVDDPDQANFMLQANILQAGRSDLRASSDALASGYGGAIIGATAAVATSGDSRSGVAAAGLLGAAASIVGDALVDDVLFSMITDIQVRERPMNGEVVTQSQSSGATQGTATTLRQSVSGGKVEWKIYRSRIVSTANKANLKFEEAQPLLIDGLIRSIGGIF